MTLFLAKSIECSLKSYDLSKIVKNVCGNIVFIRKFFFIFGPKILKINNRTCAVIRYLRVICIKK